MQNKKKPLSSTIQTLSKILKSFPNADDADQNESHFQTVLELLYDNKSYFSASEPAQSNAKRSKIALFFKTFVTSFISQCADCLKTSSNFSLRIDAGDFIFRLVECLTLSVLKEPSLGGFFETFPDALGLLRALISHNIGRQDCFLNGNEFTNLNMMKLVLVATRKDSAPSTDDFEANLAQNAHKIIEILGYCAFDCSSFDESLAGSVSQGGCAFKPENSPIRRRASDS